MAKDYLEPVEGEPHPELIIPSGDYVPPKKYDEDEEDEYEEEEMEEGVEEEMEEGVEEEMEEGVEEEMEEGVEEEEVAEERPSRTPRKAHFETEEEEEPAFVLNRTIYLKEILDDMPAIHAGEPLKYTIEYPDGTKKACCISEALHIKKKLAFTLEDELDENAEQEGEPDPDANIIARFELDEDETEEVTLICDEDGALILMTKCLFDITISTEIEYEAQKVDYNYDPFCGQH